MKKAVLLLVISLVMTNISHSQEWFTSLDIAKKLAKAQNKMLFVMWEDALSYYYPVIINDDRGNEIGINLADNDFVNNMIWEYFVPVLVVETEYEELSKQIKETRGTKYFNKLVDDSIKIMDINGNILNINTSTEFNYENITTYINRYGLNTSYLKQVLKNYSKNKNATTSFLLASKYQDFAIFVNQGVRPELIELADIYFDEAKDQLKESSFSNKTVFLQKLEMLQIKEYLILNKPRKSRRLLKRIDKTTIDKRNVSLFSFLNYTTFMLLDDEESVALWKNEISLVDLKKAEIIIKNNMANIGKSN